MRQLRRLMVSLGVVAAVVVITACGSSNSSSSQSAASGANMAASTAASSSSSASASSSAGQVDVGTGKPIPLSLKNLRVVYVTAGLNTPLGLQQEKGVNEVAAKYGLHVTTLDPRLDLTQQYNMLQTAISSGKYNAIITLPMGGQQDCNILSKVAPSKGIVVSVVTIPICGLQNASANGDGLWARGTLNTVGINTNPEALGNLASTCAKVTGGGPTALLNGVAGTPNNQSLTRAVTTAGKGLDIVANYATDYTAATGASDTAAALSAHPNLKVIFSQFPALTYGALQAIKAAGKKPGVDVKVCSQTGGTAQMLSLVKSGQVAVDQYDNDRTSAMAAMQSIIDAVQGKTDPRVIAPGPNGEITKSSGAWPPVYTQKDAGQYSPTGE